MAKRRPPMGPQLRRGRARRAPRLRVVIFTEGKNTEPSYLTSFAAEHGNSLVTLRCVGGAGVPATLVEKARQQLVTIRRSRNSFEQNDQVWVIFDEDDHPEVQQSINRARSLGIFVGYSNPCFEVWLLLHFCDHDAPDDRHQVQQKLGELVEAYDPHGAKEVDYPQLSPAYEQAKQRALVMRDRRLAEGDPMGRPFTDIDLLTQVIVDNGRTRKK